MNTNENAAPTKSIYRDESIDNLDALATDSVQISAARLEECMVLMDPETGTPAAWLDHKLPTVRNSGEVRWMAHDIDSGRLVTVALRNSLRVAVLTS